MIEAVDRSQELQGARVGVDELDPIELARRIGSSDLIPRPPPRVGTACSIVGSSLGAKDALLHSGRRPPRKHAEYWPTPDLVVRPTLEFTKTIDPSFAARGRGRGLGDGGGVRLRRSGLDHSEQLLALGPPGCLPKVFEP